MKLEDISNAGFRQLAASLSPDLQPSSPRSFELCLREDRMPVRISLHPDQQRVVMQAYAADLSMLVGPLRTGLLPMLLILNQAAIQGRPFSIGLDTRDFVSVTRIQPLDKSIGDDFLDDLDYLLQQADQVRTLINNLTLQGGNMDFAAVPGEEEAAATAE